MEPIAKRGCVEQSLFTNNKHVSKALFLPTTNTIEQDWYNIEQPFFYNNEAPQQEPVDQYSTQDHKTEPSSNE